MMWPYIMCCYFRAYNYCNARENKQLIESLEERANQILMRHVHSGISSEVLIVCGHFIYWLYRYLIAIQSQ